MHSFGCIQNDHIMEQSFLEHKPCDPEENSKTESEREAGGSTYSINRLSWPQNSSVSVCECSDTGRSPSVSSAVSFSVSFFLCKDREELGSLCMGGSRVVSFPTHSGPSAN